MERDPLVSKAFAHRCVFEAPSVRILRWRCRPAGRAPLPEREQATPLIVFLRSGNFLVQSSADIGLLDSTRAGFFNARVPFRSAHPYSGGDSGAELAVRPDVLAEILGPQAADRPDRPFRRGWAPIDERTFLLQSILLRKATAPETPDELEIEELALRLVEKAVGAGRGSPPAAAAREQDEAEALRGILSERPGAPHRLADLAARLGSTSFRLCRSFRAATGTTIHRYLVDLRLRRALVRLAGGCRDLSGLAFELGFASHSHFTETFRRRVGITPAEARGIADRRALVTARRRLPPGPAARI